MLGFTLTTIQAQSFTASVQNAATNSIGFQAEQKLSDIESLNRQIESALTRQEGKESDWQSLSERGNAELTALREEKDKLTREYEDILRRQGEAQQESYTTDSMDVFTLMGSRVNLTGEDTMLYLMMVLIILLEVCLALTAGEIKPEEKNPNHIRRTNLMRYVESLMAVKGVRLKSDKRISSESGIPEVECRRYREILQNVNHNGTPLITTVQGSSRANFSQEEMKQILENRLHRKEKGSKE